MKKLLLTSLCLVSLSAFADHHEENFDKAKQMMSEHLDKKMSMLQTAKSCVSSATNHDQLKQCRKTLHDSMKSMRSEWKGQKGAWKAQRKANKNQ